MSWVDEAAKKWNAQIESGALSETDAIQGAIREALGKAIEVCGAHRVRADVACKRLLKRGWDDNAAFEGHRRMEADDIAVDILNNFENPRYRMPSRR